MELLNLPNLRWDALSDNPILKNAFQNHGTIIGDDAALHLDVLSMNASMILLTNIPSGKQGKNPHFDYLLVGFQRFAVQ
jgi:hypothetical protein